MSIKHITFLVIPSARGRFRKLVLSHRLLAGILGLVLIFLLVSAHSLVRNIELRLRLGELAALESENRVLRVENARMELYATKMRERLESLEETTNKLSVIAGIESETAAVSDLDEGIGNIPDIAESERAPIPLEVRPPAGVDELQWDLKKLYDKSSLMEENLKGLESFYLRREQQLDHTPSISPIRPEEGYRSCGFGWRVDPFTRRQSLHRAVDISARPGTEVIAPADGVVRRAYRDAVGGNILEIDHGEGIETRYGHLKGYQVREGAKIKRGEVLAFVGNTGRSTGPHLHYEVLVDGRPMNPDWFILD